MLASLHVQLMMLFVSNRAGKGLQRDLAKLKALME
jgi:hypothetical protein